MVFLSFNSKLDTKYLYQDAPRGIVTPKTSYPNRDFNDWGGSSSRKRIFICMFDYLLRAGIKFYVMCNFGFAMFFIIEKGFNYVNYYRIELK